MARRRAGPRKVGANSQMSRARFTHTANPATVYHAGRTLPLRKRQAQMLTMLLGGDLITSQELMAVGVKNKSSLCVHLCAVRKHLPPGVRLVNVYKQGYRLIF